MTTLAHRLPLLHRSTALTTEQFERRHRGILWLIAAHLVALPIFAVLNGWTILEGLLVIVPAGALLAVAALPAPPPTVRATAAVVSLLCCSAALVWLWRGTIEAHFHYFVVVGIVALYEAVLPYAIAFTFVVLQHGAMSAWFPERVFNHTSSMEGMHGGASGWTWAAVHGGFIAALAVANLVSWKASDEVRVAEVAARDAALQSAQRFREAFNGAPTGAALIDENGTMLEVNDALAASTQVAQRGLLGRQWFQLLPVKDRPDVVAAWPPDAATLEQELPLRRADGSIGSLVWKHSRLTTGDGHARWISQTVDTSLRRDAEATVARQAAHDALTGLPNRAEFNKRVQLALDANAPTRPASLILVDLVGFRAVNTEFGHGAGDDLLVAVSQRLAGAVRGDDVLARFGGDEFVLFLPGVGAAGAHEAARGLADALTEPFPVADTTRRIGASFGVAAASPENRSVERLLRDAGLALNEA